MLQEIGISHGLTRGCLLFAPFSDDPRTWHPLAGYVCRQGAAPERLDQIEDKECGFRGTLTCRPSTQMALSHPAVKNGVDGGSLAFVKSESTYQLVLERCVFTIVCMKDC